MKIRVTSYQLPSGDTIENKTSIEIYIPRSRIFHITSGHVHLYSPNTPGLLSAEHCAKCNGDTDVRALRELGGETLGTTVIQAL